MHRAQICLGDSLAVPKQSASRPTGMSAASPGRPTDYSAMPVTTVCGLFGTGCASIF